MTNSPAGAVPVVNPHGTGETGTTGPLPCIPAAVSTPSSMPHHHVWRPADGRAGRFCMRQCGGHEVGMPRRALTDDQVAEIRRRRAHGEPLRQIAADFGIAFATVRNVCLADYRGYRSRRDQRMAEPSGWSP